MVKRHKTSTRRNEKYEFGRPRKEFVYQYSDLAALTGKTVEAVWMDVSRGLLQPSDLSSVVKWLARYGKTELRQEIAEAVFKR